MELNNLKNNEMEQIIYTETAIAIPVIILFLIVVACGFVKDIWFSNTKK